MNRFGRLRVPAVAVALLASTLIACSSVGSVGTTPGTAAADGYLYASSSEAIFLKWAAASGATSGSVDWRTAPAQRITADFTVEATANGGFSFRFEPGSLAGWTGQLDGAALTLLIPSSTGSLREVPMRTASAADFEAAAAAIR